MTVTRSVPTRAAPFPAAPQEPPGGFGPPPRGRPARSVAGAMLGAALIVLCAATVAVYTAGVGHRRAVLVIARPVQAGAVIQNADLGEVRVSADPSLRSIAAGQRPRIVGRVATVNLVVGTLVTPGQLATGPRVDADHAIVGLALKSGQYPNGLRALDRVLAVDTGPPAALAAPSTPAAAGVTILVADAEVSGSTVAVDGQSSAVAIVVPRPDAPLVAAAGARGQVSLILLGGPGGR